MMKKMTIKPAKGYNVRKPDGDFLDKKGEEVPASVYWRRRMTFGEIVLVKKDNAQIPKVKHKKEETKKETKKETKEETKEETKQPEAEKAEPKKPAKKAPAKKTEKAKESK